MAQVWELFGAGVLGVWRRCDFYVQTCATNLHFTLFCGAGPPNKSLPAPKRIGTCARGGSPSLPMSPKAGPCTKEGHPQNLACVQKACKPCRKSDIACLAIIPSLAFPFPNFAETIKGMIMVQQAGRGEILIYQTEDGKAVLDVKLENETVWLTQSQLCDLFERDKSVISRHIRNIFEEGELHRESTVAKKATVVHRGFRGDVKRRRPCFSISW